MFLRSIDSWLHDCTRKNLHRFQRLTGVTSFDVCLQLRVVTMLVTIGMTGKQLWEGHWGVALIWTWINFGSYFPLFLMQRIVTKWRDNPKVIPSEALIMRHDTLVGSLVSCLFTLLIVWLFYAASDSLSLRVDCVINLVNILLIELFSYAIWVNPLPPCTSKVREWLRGFGKTLVPIFNGNN